MIIELALTLVLHTTIADTTDVAVPEGSVSVSTWQCLGDAGYVGRPDDGMEALYVPADALTRCQLLNV